MLNTIILFGAFQGLIMSALLFFSKRDKLASRLLGILIFLIALASINIYGNYVNWFNSDFMQFFTQVMPMIVIMPVGPLLYYYVRSSAEPGFKLPKTFKYHFYPVLIDLIPSLAIIAYLLSTISGWLPRNPKPWVNFVDQFNVYSDAPRWLSVTVYVVLAYRYIPRSISNTKLNWLKQFITVFIFFQVIWLIYLIPYLLPRYSNKMLDVFGWYPIYIPLTILIYWLGIRGYNIALTQHQEAKKLSDIRNLLSDDVLISLTKSLTASMEIEKLYLDPGINLNALARHVKSPPKIVSAVLNQHFKKSFNDFINEYRILEFKEKFISSDFEHLTITGIALECGFNSQATFQRVFKEFTGLSPSGFRKTLINPGEKTSQIMI